MVAVIGLEDLELNKRARIEYGVENQLEPMKKVTHDKYGVKHTDYVDYVFDVATDHAVTRQRIKEELELSYLNPRFETEADWQNRKVDEFVLVDGKK